MPKKDYPLHPGQTIADPYFVEIPMEEFERLKALDRTATEGGKHPESENETLKKVNAKLQDEIALLKICFAKAEGSPLRRHGCILRLLRSALCEPRFKDPRTVRKDLEKPQREMASNRQQDQGEWIMDKRTINLNLAKKIAVNEKNSGLERALAGKLVDIYARLAERAEEADKYRKILYS